MTHDIQIKPTSIVVFGGTGDLAKRKLFPAFFNLYMDGRMPSQFQIIALGRQPYEQESFRDYVHENILAFSRNTNFSQEQWQAFQDHITFHKAHIDDDSSYDDLNMLFNKNDALWGERGNRLFYLSIAPSFIEQVSSGLKRFQLADDVTGDRIIFEKPFGYDKSSAIRLNKLLANTFHEQQIYRIDHYLGKETVQNILAFRFGNSIFEPLWNNRHIDSVQITVAEQVGVENRGGYYDHSGALRDMIQNHLLQILCMVAMEAPEEFESEQIRDRKADLLKSVRRIKREDINHYTVRAQYDAGQINGLPKKAYRDEPGVNPLSTTETFVAMKFYIDNERWLGVPFYMRTGKSLQQKHSAVVINFKDSTKTKFPANKNSIENNQLTINIQPEMDIRLSFMSKQPGLDMEMTPAQMVFDYFQCASNGPEAYETLLLDALDGDSTLFMRSDQVEEAWDIIEAIQEEWEHGDLSPIYSYPAGSWGPEAADELLKRQGHRWLSSFPPFTQPAIQKHGTTV
ncbi:glucose-6-phosphate dehydrogenase [Sphingobacterium griseoflavum]|uniref:Glucose-6-phosphate 1-dehydrogenase n=1 Tax=Sphingobacterium griseoflavum TaxID=1474952 RepID=A0ABQ3HZ75_9SPHI|nr:glucose-6-phosphate dehydrogenase [Sphingobacterium griseoflavum]GHE33958.1 glucose-6-phosphate 1-dehydrogenase [Sphingobacterium griseoflavum]